MGTAVNFDASVDCESVFSHGFIAENCQKRDLLNLCRPFKNFSSVCTNNENELSFVTPTGLSGETVESFSGCSQS